MIAAATFSSGCVSVRSIVCVATSCAAISLAFRPSFRSCQSRASWRPAADCGSRPSTARLHAPWNSLIAQVPTIPPTKPATAPFRMSGLTCRRVIASSLPRSSMRLLLPLQNPRDRPDHLFAQRPLFPFLQRDAIAPAEIGPIVRSQPRRDRRVPNHHIGLVVVLEGSVIDVGGSDCGPEVVDNQRFRVDHAGFVFEYP